MPDVLVFWAVEGWRLYLHRAHAAQVLVAVPALSAMPEHDFCTAGSLIASAPGRMDALSYFAEKKKMCTASKKLSP